MAPAKTGKVRKNVIRKKGKNAKQDVAGKAIIQSNELVNDGLRSLSPPQSTTCDKNHQDKHNSTNGTGVSVRIIPAYSNANTHASTGQENIAASVAALPQPQPVHLPKDKCFHGDSDEDDDDVVPATQLPQFKRAVPDTATSCNNATTFRDHINTVEARMEARTATTKPPSNVMPLQTMSSSNTLDQNQ
jgi:hypothetical protein